MSGLSKILDLSQLFFVAINNDSKLLACFQIRDSTMSIIPEISSFRVSVTQGTHSIFAIISSLPANALVRTLPVSSSSASQSKPVKPSVRLQSIHCPTFIAHCIPS
jgi:hypothetical protein